MTEPPWCFILVAEPGAHVNLCAEYTRAIDYRPNLFGSNLELMTKKKAPAILRRFSWLRDQDSNLGPHGYEPCELPLLHPATYTLLVSRQRQKRNLNVLYQRKGLVVNYCLRLGLRKS